MLWVEFFFCMLIVSVLILVVWCFCSDGRWIESSYM
jgi:hypothetical protein